MSVSSAILALLTGVAGWFYLFYSKAAADLSELEDQAINARRIRLRRVGGGVMVLLAAGLYVGFAATDEPVNPRLFVLVWSAVMILLGLLVLLALIDVRLTVRLRNQRRRRGHRGTALDRDGPS
jgi:UDP-N-acetylmuramyl pentapeptide phosphotransferase/UDP-N-acetylglucosamine-1-phosphate transferase